MLLRHLAFCLSAGLAYLNRQNLSVGNSFLYAAAGAGLLNLGASLLAQWPRITGISRGLSFLFGILSWCSMAALTGGTESPFVVGLGLEVVLSVMIGSPLTTALVATGAIAGLWAQEFLARVPSAGFAKLFLLTVLFLFMGMLACYAALHWRLQTEQIALQARAFTQRLTFLERELEDLRPLGRCGEDSARVSHELKGQIANLRAYCQLLERGTRAGETHRRALFGLKEAVDQMERTALSSLLPFKRGVSMLSGDEISQALQDVLDEVGTRHPLIRWNRAEPKERPNVRVPPTLLREVLLVLTENAAEALEGRGEVRLVTSAEQGSLRIDISDDGPGIATDIREQLFRPGATTKSTGSGLGLFLARRLVEFHGGSLIAAPGIPRGTTFTLRLPVQQV